MKNNMLRVDDKIQNHHARDEGEPGRHAEKRQEPPAPRLDSDRDANRRGRRHQAHHEHVDDENCEVVRPAHRPVSRIVPARSQRLPQRHGREDGEEGTEPDSGFARQHWRRSPVTRA